MIWDIFSSSWSCTFFRLYAVIHCFLKAASADYSLFSFLSSCISFFFVMMKSIFYLYASLSLRNFASSSIGLMFFFCTFLSFLYFISIYYNMFSCWTINFLASRSRWLTNKFSAIDCAFYRSVFRNVYNLFICSRSFETHASIHLSVTCIRSFWMSKLSLWRCWLYFVTGWFTDDFAQLAPSSSSSSCIKFFRGELFAIRRQLTES